MFLKTSVFWPYPGMLALASALALAVGSPARAQQSSAQAQDQGEKPKPKKVWTDDDLKVPPAKAARQAAPDGAAEKDGREHYMRSRDPKWYARELQPLREALAKLDMEIRSLQEARKDGKGASEAVALYEEPEGVNPDGQMDVLKRERADLLRKIDELEEQARRSSIRPGDLRDERLLQPDAGAASGGGEAAEPATKSRVEQELERQVAEQREQLGNSLKEADLLQRDLKLHQQQEGSSAQPHLRRDKAPASVGISKILSEKRVEVAELQQKIAELEDRLKDEQLKALARKNDGSTKDEALERSSEAPPLTEAEVEAQWRKQFAEIDYKIRIAKAELDILQRELNLGLVQYSPNPATTMKESITRKQINEHRKAIQDKQKELAGLNAVRVELEDELRHAGGPAGWSR